MCAGGSVRALFNIAAVGAALLGMACGGGAPRHTAVDVAGWYVRDISGGREVIDVRPNGGYVHVVTVQDSGGRADEARWHAAGDSAITLTDFRSAAQVGHGAPRADSARVAIHAAPGGELRLVLPGDTASFVRRLRYGKQRGG